MMVPFTAVLPNSVKLFTFDDFTIPPVHSCIGEKNLVEKSISWVADLKCQSLPKTIHKYIDEHSSQYDAISDDFPLWVLQGASKRKLVKMAQLAHLNHYNETANESSIKP